MERKKEIYYQDLKKELSYQGLTEKECKIEEKKANLGDTNAKLNLILHNQTILNHQLNKLLLYANK